VSALQAEFLDEHRMVETQPIKLELAVVGYHLTSWQVSY